MKTASLLREIRDAKPKNKKKIMASNPQLRGFFRHAYDPFIKFGIPKEKIENEFPSLNKSGFYGLSEMFTTLNEIKNRAITGNEAVAEALKTMEGLSLENATLMKNILEKDLKIGVNRKTVDEVWPDLLSRTEDGKPKIPIMLCKTYDSKKVKFPCLLSIKKRRTSSEIYLRKTLYKIV